MHPTEPASLFSAQFLSYHATGAFSNLVLDYLDGAAGTQAFYKHPPTWHGMAQAFAAKSAQPVNRTVLVDVLHQQYKTVSASSAVTQNIDALKLTTTFTVCTAHQPNLFTGPAYFIYKIVHAIKLAAELAKRFPKNHFVPVYYMGSEDADIDELNHTYINGKKLEWNTAQTGAVGRMQLDKNATTLLQEMRSQLGVQPFGTEIMELLEQTYTEGSLIQQATFRMVHALFEQYGLVVLIADHGDLKKLMAPVFQDDLFNNTPSQLVIETGGRLSETYRVQAQPRTINLFYLADGIRNRIERADNGFTVVDTNLFFTDDEMRAELEKHPERFSPNVILRGLYQETLLPNIAFVGGGGELAYWLQLNDLFAHYAVPFPVLVLRNSYLVIDKKQAALIQKNGVSAELLFKTQLSIVNTILDARGQLPDVTTEALQLKAVYEGLKKLAAAVDPTLENHVGHLQHDALQRVHQLEKKLARAERRKHDELARQVQQLKSQLFPNNNLQERTENMASFYARWGRPFIDALLQHAPALEQRFAVLTEND